MTNTLTSISFAAKDSKKRTLEDCGDVGPMSKYLKVLEEAVNVTSTNREFRTIHHSVVTYEQTKEGLSYFYPKRIEDGMHTKPLHLKVLRTVLSVCSISYILINFFKLLQSFYTAFSIRRRRH